MAVLLALSVRVLEVVAWFGLKDAVTPLGKPEADKVTLLLKPFWGVTLIVLVPLLPWAMLTLFEAESVKFGPAVMVTETVAVWVKPPTVPVTATVAAPVVAALVAVRVMVLEPVVGFGLNDAVTPPGRPEADKLTLLVKPLCGVTVTLLVPLDPWAILTLLGDADREKFPTTVTASVMVVELVRLPEVPVIVRVVLPVVAVLVAVRVRTLEVVAGFGLNDAVTPAGRPDADKLTLPPKPFCSLMVIVVVTLVPAVSVKVGGAESVKPGVVFGQLLTRFAALMLPMPVAKSHPTPVP
jgi:hypothetical protein